MSQIHKYSAEFRLILLGKIEDMLVILIEEKYTHNGIIKYIINVQLELINWEIIKLKG